MENQHLTTKHGGGEDIFLYTHGDVDLDAVFATWAAIRFAPNMAKAKIMFVPANWSGIGMGRYDMAVDIEANGRGFKGEKKDGRVHSAFKMIMEKFAPQQIINSMKPIIHYVDAHDAHGNVFQFLSGQAPNTENLRALARADILHIFNGLKIIIKSDEQLIKQMFLILDGLLQLQLERKKINAEAAQDESIEKTPDGRIVICNKLDKLYHEALFRQGAEIVIFYEGNNLGLRRSNNCKKRMEDLVIDLIKKHGEESKWFSHEAGYLFCHGNKKSLADCPSAISERDLFSETIKNFYK